MKKRLTIAALLATAVMVPAMALAQDTKTATPTASRPNIVIFWGDDIGQSDISAYSHGSWASNAQHRSRCEGRDDVH